MIKPLRVLIVDGAEENALLLAAELERGSYAVTWELVDTAATMRAALERELWDVILCDFTLPYFFGSGAALHVAREFGPDVPFIYISGVISEDMALETMKSGANDCIARSELQRLVPVIERELRQAQLRRESRRAEAVVHESEHKYRHVFEALADAVLLIDEKNGRIVDANSRTETLLGRSRPEILRLNQSEIIAPSDGQLTFGMVWLAAAGGKPSGCDMEVLLPGGGRTPVHVAVSRVELYERQFLLAVLRDVTERNRMEEQLRQLSRAVEQSPASVMITGMDGSIQYVNAKFVAVTGYALGEVYGKNPRLLKSGNMPRETYQKLWETLVSGQTWRGEFLNRKKNGELYWELASISPILNESGEITNYLAVKEDITERKLLEERLREQAELLHLAHDAIAVRDLEDRILFWNKSAERLSGWTELEVMGKDIKDLLIHNHPKYTAAKKAVLEEGVWDGELTIRTRNGHDLMVQARWTLVRDSGGNPKAILSINTDITEKKKLEAQLLRAQRMESVGILAGGIAHDLNNILTPILMSVRMLRDDLDVDEKSKLLEILEANVLRGTNLVKQVLAFGRGIKGERIPINLALIMREIGQIIHETFPKSIEYSFQTTEKLWTILGDATQLHQVLLNLCVNSRDAMPEGGKLSLRIENVTLTDDFVRMNPGSKPGPFIVVTVKDTGIGIPKSIQDKIFDPFFTTKELGKGTGLGLSTTLGIVRSHGGFIHCYSEVGCGSTFRVYLPATVNHAAAAPSGAETPLPAGRNELVLVVDDEEAVRAVVKKTLEYFGYRVLPAANGAEAVALYRANQTEIAAVITDVAMPVMDGPATITALKAIDQDVKIIVSSGFSSDDNVERATAAGVQCFIPKPYAAKEMLQALHSLLHSD